MNKIVMVLIAVFIFLIVVVSLLVFERNSYMEQFSTVFTEVSKLTHEGKTDVAITRCEQFPYYKAICYYYIWTQKISMNATVETSLCKAFSSWKQSDLPVWGIVGDNDQYISGIQFTKYKCLFSVYYGRDAYMKFENYFYEI